LPKGKGTWPAFWMMPCNNDFVTNPWPKCGEIDIMEVKKVAGISSNLWR
jgi:beta-glucanase (GH16 family)